MSYRAKFDAILPIDCALAQLGEARAHFRLARSCTARLCAWVGLRLYGHLNLAHFNKVVSATLLLAGIALTLKGL